MVSLNMHISVLLALFAVLTNAHFQLQFPPPRGPFVEPQEVNFCDAYNSVNTSRTQFPLSGGFYSLNSEHLKWTIGVFISTVANPTSFQDFSQIGAYAQLSGEGLYCLPLDLSKSNVTGLQSGENATLQMLFNGGDGNLYQCADITLETTVNLTSIPCSNATVQTNTSISNSFGISTAIAPTSLVIGTSIGIITLALALMQ